MYRRGVVRTTIWDGRSEYSRLRHDVPQFGWVQRRPPVSGLYEGQSAPPLEMELIQGRVVTAVDANVSGRTLIVFFSTACIYCLESLPVYEEVARSVCDLRIVFAVLDRRADELRSWWLASSWDPGDECAEVLVGSPSAGFNGYGIRGTPTHILVEDGKVLNQEAGALRKFPEWLRTDT